jgi:transcription initiation factor TFIIF subunit beta
MEEENGYGGSSGSNLETSKAERSVWLMKCPVAVAKSWQNHPPSQPLSKVVFSIDPLLPEDDPAHLQVFLLLLLPFQLYPYLLAHSVLMLIVLLL